MTIPPQPTFAFGLKQDRIEYLTSVIHKDSQTAIDLSPFLVVNYLSMHNHVTANKNRISEIARLSDNWDGYGGIAPKERVIKNAFKFLDALSAIGVNDIDQEDIYPMPYGSIVMEINDKNGMVSIEIGNYKIGFFTDYKNNKNTFSEGEETNFKTIPQNLLNAINILRYGV